MFAVLLLTLGVGCEPAAPPVHPVLKLVGYDSTDTIAVNAPAAEDVVRSVVLDAERRKFAPLTAHGVPIGQFTSRRVSG
jgi:hypothetical protein